MEQDNLMASDGFIFIYFFVLFIYLFILFVFFLLWFFYDFFILVLKQPATVI